MLRAMFGRLTDQPDLLPPTIQLQLQKVGIKRGVGDYLAGMTDRFFQREYARLFGIGSAD
jgi:dGTPase